ncbi:ABC transporter permease [Spirochaetia bacterium]|nr:ABC transporter permease [Spirochaetia bacterium]GHV60901.1 ABC transporter permease [Spirochaetia bacterium]
MKKYIISRIVLMFVLLFLVSIFSFVVIQLPPGDFVTKYAATLALERGTTLGPEFEAALRKQLGFDKSLPEQYLYWMQNLLHGDMGRSLEWRQSVNVLVMDRLPLTIGLSIITLFLTYAIAIPIGIFSARHQYSALDYIFTCLGFIGIATPSFFLALVLMYVLNHFFGASVGGIYSVEFMNAPQSFARFIDLCKHMPLPIFIIMIQGMAGIIRVMRGQLLDEIKRPYVVAARARGLEENNLIYRYPVRVALNPIVSSAGNMLASIVSGMTITAIVLNVPTIGSLLYTALLSQDMYLAGSCIMILSALTVIGMFLSDILLVVVDPRIRLN